MNEIMPTSEELFQRVMDSFECLLRVTTELAQEYLFAVKQYPELKARFRKVIPHRLLSNIEKVASGRLIPELATETAPAYKEISNYSIEEQKKYFDAEVEVYINGRIYNKKLINLPPKLSKQVFSPTGVRTVDEQKEYLSENQKSDKIVNKVRVGKGVAEIKGIFSAEDIEKQIIRKMFTKKQLIAMIDDMPENKLSGAFG